MENIRVVDARAEGPDGLGPGWLVRAWRWLDRSTDGIRPWLILLGFVSGFGFAFFRGDLHDRDVAQDLAAHGQWEVAREGLVHVQHVSSRGGGYNEIDGVRVRLKDVTDLVELTAPNAGAQDDLDEDVVEGWQRPTEATGYQTPLTVRVRRDGEGQVVAAMAKGDYAYWSGDNTDPELGLGLGVGGLTLGALSIGFNRARLRWSERRRTRPPAAHRS